MAPTPPKKKKTSEHWQSALPLLKELVRPRRGLLAFGFLLTIIGQLCSLVLPGSSRYFIDNVIGKGQIWLMKPLILAVLGATLIQAATSFTLTQLLSKAAQRLIAELRRRVQEHIGRLTVAYYDANKSGALVSRIMTDVEGVRNLVGTGLVDFLGGILTAVFALVILLKISALLTAVALVAIGGFAFGLSMAFKRIRPIFRERGKITAEVSGRLTESLAGVRVVKGYHAEAAEARVFAGGVQRLLDNVLRSITAISRDEPLRHHADGPGGRGRNVHGRAADRRRAHLTARRVHEIYHVPGIPGGAHVPGGGYRHADHRSAGRAGPHAGSAAGAAGGRRRAAHQDDRAIHGHVTFDHVVSPTIPASPCCTM